MLKNLIDINKVGPKIKQYYENIGVYTPYELLFYFPRDYELLGDITKIINLELNDVKFIKGKIIDNPRIYYKNKLKIVSVNIKDDTGIIKCIWFNSPYIANRLKINEELIFRGKVNFYKNVKIFTQPKIWSLSKFEKEKNTLSPIYSLTKGISNDLIKENINFILSSLNENDFIEFLNKDFLEKNQMLDINDSLRSIHFPNNIDDLIKAHNRLAFQEFLLFIVGLKISKNTTSVGREEFKKIDIDLLEKTKSSLPYKLTDDQIKCIEDILNDFKNNKKVNRMIEGDVGSGKTIVSFIISILISKINIQSVIMAPTEVLAMQHYNNLKELINDLKLNIKIELLTGSIKAKERKIIIDGIKNNDIKIIIGTHAVYSNDIEYYDLGLIIIDEQHRFGVNQRKSLEKKGNYASIISMSATPIPRTLSMILYNGMDISLIKEKPGNRLPIKNAIIMPSERLLAYKKMIEEVLKGNKCYIICSSIQNDDEYGSFNNTQNVYDYEEIINNYIKTLKINKKINVKVLHGKLESSVKNKIINDFINGQIDILISTTVVEVGVDCKMATYILVEDAQRFGLATLHQLRGRVGRNDLNSYAIFVDTANTDESRARLKVLKDSNDGFYIAESDLKLRGPGDMFGIRQSGSIDFKIADIYNDNKLLILANEYSDLMINNDYLNFDPRFELFKTQLDEYLKNGYTI